MERSDYGLEQDELSFEKKSSALFNRPIDDSLLGIVNNPINKPFAEFEKEYVRLDVAAQERFNELDELLRKFEGELQDNPTYDYMDIIMLIKSILVRYKIWATALRQTAFLAKEKMKEAEEINRDYYLSPSDVELMKNSWIHGTVDKEGKIVPEDVNLQTNSKVSIVLDEEEKIPYTGGTSGMKFPGVKKPRKEKEND